MRDRLRSVGVLAALVVLCGCVERHLRVETEPPGAVVYVNGARVGTSPVEWSFLHYGTVQVQVEPPASARWADQYYDWSGAVPLHPPWYQRVPFTLFAELFDPRTHVDARSLKVELVAVPPPTATSAEEDQALRERAKTMRDRHP